MRTGTFVRSLNRKDVLQEVWSNAPISRADISKRLGMSRSAVSDIVEQLISEGFIREIGTCESTSKGGRPSVRLEFVPTARYAFGIDIGATKTIFLLTDLNGTVTFQRKIPSHQPNQNSIEHIRTEAKRFLIDSGIAQENIIGTGVGAPGLVDYANGIVVAAPGFHWNNVNLKEAFKGVLPEPIFVDNDVNMALIGEKRKGTGEKYKDVVFVAIGTGIGTALMINGRIHRGNDGYAGEVGYFQVDPFTNLTSHAGTFGALEQFASGTGIKRHAESLLEKYPNSTLQEKEIHSELVFEAAAQHDELALYVIETTVKYIAFALSQIVALLNPGMIILGGGVSQCRSDFLSKIQERVEQLIPIRTNFVLADLGNMAGAYGAAATPILDLYGNVD